MRSSKQDRQTLHPLFGAYVAGVWLVVYLYVLLRVRPELLYHLYPNVFLFDAYYLASFFRLPGGAVDYAAAFLSTLMAPSWLGALVITLLTILLCSAVRQLLAAVSGTETGGHLLFLLPAVAILLLLGQYVHPVRLCVGLVTTLLLANAYAVIVKAPLPVRLAAFLITCALGYCIVAGLCVIFACLCGLMEWKVQRQRTLGTLYILLAVALPMAASQWWCDMNLQQAYRGLLFPWPRYALAVPSSEPRTLAIWTVAVALPVALVVLCRSRSAAESKTIDSEAASDAPGPVDVPQTTAQPPSPLRLALYPAVLFVMVIGGDFLALDTSKRCSLRIACSAESSHWKDVLARAQETPQQPDLVIMSRVNQALYYNGILLDRMFAYLQILHTPTLMLIQDNIDDIVRTTPLECGSILFDLGCVNKAEHLTYEALEILGDRPDTLKRLVYIHVLKGEPEAARRYLGLLERSLWYRSWARRHRQQLDADETLGQIPSVVSLRQWMVTDDFIGMPNAEKMLQRLLQRNRRHRMAFEYLMAHYLLTQQLDKLVANLYRLDDFEYPHLPRHCAEALVMYQEATGNPGPDLGNRTIDPQTRQRYYDFVQALQKLRARTPGALRTLQRDFGDSYYFCNTFGQSKVGR